MSTTQFSRAAFTQDGYGVVANSADTFRAAADELHLTGSLSMGWTDNAMSHMDVLLVLSPTQIGPSNRMDADTAKLFVAVAGFGMFGFRLRADDPLHPSYLAEKVGMRYSVTTEALAELVNGVMNELVQAATA